MADHTLDAQYSNALKPTSLHVTILRVQTLQGSILVKEMDLVSLKFFRPSIPLIEPATTRGNTTAYRHYTHIHTSRIHFDWILYSSVQYPVSIYTVFELILVLHVPCYLHPAIFHLHFRNHWKFWNSMFCRWKNFVKQREVPKMITMMTMLFHHQLCPTNWRYFEFTLKHIYPRFPMMIFIAMHIGHPS